MPATRQCHACTLVVPAQFHGSDMTGRRRHWQAALEMLKARTAAEAMALFFASERIYQDMLLAKDRPERWQMNYCVREWVPMDIGMEFRGFVANGALNALSQYNHLVFFADLAAKKDQVAAVITEFFCEKIIPKLAGLVLPSGLRLESYIIDFALIQDDGEASASIQVRCT